MMNGDAHAKLFRLRATVRPIIPQPLKQRNPWENHYPTAACAP
jgi:hypothetical protein